MVLMVLGGGVLFSNTGESVNAKGMQAQTIYSNSVLLKNKEIRFSFVYPSEWHLVQGPGGYVITVQNVPPFNNITEVTGGLPEGFVKVSFMVDPKANPQEVFSRGEQVSMNGRSWQRGVTTGESFGDYEVWLETVVDDVVLRIYGYVALTHGKTWLQERQAFEVDRIAGSIKIEPPVFLNNPPAAPAFPPNGKPQATPSGKPRVP